jgi:hypothetical protein
MVIQKTQQECVLEHLQVKPITPIEALNLYGCFRLSSIIYRLRRLGHNIETRPYPVKDRKNHEKIIAQYYLA